MNNIELYKLAKKHLGEGGSKARAYCGLPSGAAWCNAYVCYIANEGGVKNLYFNGTKQTYCPTSIRWCDANLAEIPPYLAMPMDIIYFDWDKNGVPNHIGFVKEKKDASSIYTHEGNTSGGIVDEKTRTANYVLGIYRPKFEPTEPDKKQPVTCSGDFGWQSIYALQRALGLKADGILTRDTIKALQKKAGTSADGSWGKATSKAVQKMVGADADGYFGKNSVIALQKWINKENEEDTKSEYEGELPTLQLKKTNAEVIADTITWAKWIANDNDFHYGHGKDAHHNGCYFCGTQPSSKKKAGIVNYEHTYCCNPFVGAAWAHGGCVPEAMSLCTKGKSWGMIESEGYSKSKLFNHLGHPAKSKLKAGDVLCKDKHVMLYIGNGKVAEAAGGDDNKVGSESWNNSITVRTLTSDRYKTFPRVHRFNGSVNTTAAIKHGEVSDRVKLWQKFLNWYFDEDVVSEDRIFGDASFKHTKEFQKLEGLTADGIIGKSTLEKAKKIKK